MYRVSNSARSIESCQLIYQAVATFLRRGAPLHSIKISDVAKLSTVSRGTFYRHFDSIVDVVIWQSDRKTAQSCKKKLLMNDNRLFVSNYFEYWSHERDFLDLMADIGRLDIILASLEKIISTWTPMLLAGTHLNAMHEQYLIRIWAVVIWSILCTWIYRGKQDGIDELTDMALHNLPDVHEQDITSVFGGFSVPSLKGELRFVARHDDIDHYIELGCTRIAWSEMPDELSEDCGQCRHFDSCDPVPMRFLND